MSRCMVCGHPDSRHRIVDAIVERMATGESQEDVLHDYGWTAPKFVMVSREVAEAELRVGNGVKTVRKLLRVPDMSGGRGWVESNEPQ